MQYRLVICIVYGLSYIDMFAIPFLFAGKFIIFPCFLAQPYFRGTLHVWFLYFIMKQQQLALDPMLTTKLLFGCALSLVEIKMLINMMSLT